MKSKKGDILFVILIVIIAILINVLIIRNFNDLKNGFKKNCSNDFAAVIVDVYDDKLVFYSKENGLSSTGIKNSTEDIYTQGQEVRVYYEGLFGMGSSPKNFTAKKIKILKQESDIEIPEYILRFCYNSLDKVYFVVNELTKEGISFTIIDSNDFIYEYNSFNNFSNYVICKKYKYGDFVEIQKNMHNVNITGEMFINDSEATVIKKKIEWSEVYKELEARRLLFDDKSR